MSAPNLINPSDLYDRAYAVARAAVAGSPRALYSLTDIVDDDALWQAIFDTAFLSIMPLHATLDGCAQALKSLGANVAEIATVQIPVPGSTLVSQTDWATARRWLINTVARDLDRDQQQLMIVDYVLEYGLETHSVRLTSLMVAVVETAGAVKV